MADLEKARQLASQDHGLAVVATTRRDGTIQTSVRDVFTAAGGTHDEWDEYDRVMAAEGRVAVFVMPDRVWSNPGT